MTGKRVILEAEIDPAIIGGIIIRIGDKLIDGSLRRKLELMNKKMTD
jgi:F-type H+-transporting ATPase subunit delta